MKGEFGKRRRIGAVLPLVALVLSFVLLGFSALVVDAGMLYGVRRNMVTAADSAALAGAQVMVDALGTANYNKAVNEAVNDAIELAMKNGVLKEADISARVVFNAPGYNRDVIIVEVKNNSELTFGKALGINDTDVAARAVATWGYITQLEGGDIIPVFTKDTDYQTEHITYLHSDKFIDNNGDIVNGNWGLLDIFSNTNTISKALAGELIGQSLKLDWVLDNQTGLNVGNVNKPIEDRMKTANSLESKEDRIKFMSGLVPVIDWDLVTKQGSSLRLPIKHFAVFEIYDIIVSEGNNNNKKSQGSPFALYDTPNYKSDGIAIEYESVDGKDIKKSSIIGKFTDTIVQVRTVVNPGDQSNPTPGKESAKYYKLID